MPLADIMKDAEIANGVKELVCALYVAEDGILHFPDHSLNDVNISYYVNHSREPNMFAVESNDALIFLTSRAIQKGEELLVDYTTYAHE